MIDKTQPIDIRDLAQVWGPDEIYRQSGLKAGRALFFSAHPPAQYYLRDDGTTEPFDWSLHPDQGEQTFVLLGRVRRDATGSVDLDSVRALLAPQEA